MGVQENAANPVNDLYSIDQSGTFDPASNRFTGNDFQLFRLNGTPVTPLNGVPEPSTVVLGGLVVVLGVLAKRRFRN